MMDVLRLIASAFALGVMIGFVLSDRLNRAFWFEAGQLDARIGRLEEEIRDREGEGEEWKETA